MKTLMERDTGDGIVKMVYHGADETPKVTVDFSPVGFNATITMVPPESEVMEWYLHPHYYLDRS